MLLCDRARIARQPNFGHCRSHHLPERRLFDQQWLWADQLPNYCIKNDRILCIRSGVEHVLKTEVLKETEDDFRNSLLKEVDYLTAH